VGPIGVFDSGYGGLTILEAFRRHLPQYDYLYLGDNARTPYGSRSFEVVYQFTLEAVRFLMNQGCPLVILACNTASAKALRSIQQRDLTGIDSSLGRLYETPDGLPSRRVLGVLRPTVEAVGSLTKSRHVGIVATPGTIQSESYPIEIHKLNSDITVVGKACPMWVPLVENGESGSPGAAYFVNRYLTELFEQDPAIDTLILGCTHYPLLLPQIRQFLPPDIHIVNQGEHVASCLSDYLERHALLNRQCTQGGTCNYLTTESVAKFEEQASAFTRTPVSATQIHLL